MPPPPTPDAPPPGSAFVPGPAPGPTPGRTRLAPFRGLLLGDFVLGAPAGAGGFGTVHHGWQTATGRRVALKLLHPGLSTDILARFQREAAYLARFNHPHIAAVFGFFEAVPGAPTDPDIASEEWAAALGSSTKRAFIAMEWVDGRTLEAVFRDPAGRPDTATLTRWFTEAAEALAAVHAANLIHRDVKPGNLMVTADGTLKLMDFGIARPQGEERTLVTAAGSLFGTLAYMSPEQLRAAQADAEVGPATDLYSLGATFYELFTGQRVLGHDTQSAEALCTLKLSGARPARAPLRARGLAWELETLIMGCLEPEPSDRPRSMNALAEDLRRFQENETIRYQRPSWVRRVRLGLRRNRREAALSLAFAAVLLALAAWWWCQPGQLQLELAPPGATLEIHGRSYPVGAEPLRLTLPAGPCTLRLSAPDHRTETREVNIPRGGEKALALSLAHEQGTLSAEVRPAGAELLLDGRAYGSRLVEHALDTGRHRLVAAAADHFDAAMDLVVAPGEAHRRHVDLDEGVLWRIKDSSLQSGFIAVPDQDGDGVADILHNCNDALVLYAGGNGTRLGSLPLVENTSRTFTALDLGGKLGRAAISACDTSGLGADFGPELQVFSLDRPLVAVRCWSATPPGPTPASLRPAGVGLLATDDIDGDGVRELAIGTHGGLHLINLVDFRHRDLRPADWTPLTALIPLGCVGTAQERGLLYRGERGGETHVGAVALDDARRMWHKTLPAGTQTMVLPVANASDLLLGSADHLERVDGANGRAQWKIPLPFPLGAAPLRSGNMLLLLAADPTRGIVAISADTGAVAWRNPIGATAAQQTGPDGELFRAGDGTVLLAVRDAVVFLDPATGQVRHILPGTCEGVLQGEPRAGGKPDLLITLRGTGLLCLDDNAAPRWTLRLEDALRPDLLLSSPGGVRILLHRHAAQLAVARGPLLAFKAKAEAPLEAAPRVIGSGAAARLIQLGHFANGCDLRAFRSDGTIAWSCPDSFAPNGAPAIGDVDHNGQMAVVALGTGLGDAFQSVRIYAADDGRLLRAWPLPGSSWIGCTPALVDLDGDRTLDIVLARYDTHDFLALSGHTGQVLWKHDTGCANIGTPVASDLDGDGKPEIIAIAGDGRVLAWDGPSGKVLWSAACGADSRRPPSVADLDNDGKPEIVVGDATGCLIILSSAPNAAPRASMPLYAGSAGPAMGAAQVLSTGGRTLLIASMGAAGIVAFNGPGPGVAWSYDDAGPVSAAPILATLRGERLLWAVTTDGTLFALDPANGHLRFRLATPAHAVTADPVVADLDGDGLPEVVIADGAFQLTVIDGRNLPATK